MHCSCAVSENDGHSFSSCVRASRSSVMQLEYCVLLSSILSTSWHPASTSRVGIAARLSASTGAEIPSKKSAPISPEKTGVDILEFLPMVLIPSRLKEMGSPLCSKQFANSVSNNV